MELHCTLINLIRARLIKEISKVTEHLECMFIEINVSNVKTVCGIVYRRPDSNKQLFLNDIELIVSDLTNKYRNIYIMGDFNLNMLQYKTCPTTKDMINMFNSFNIFPTITKPTRVTLRTATVIDHFWTNKYNSLGVNGIIYNQITDHFPIFSIFNINNQNKNTQNHIDRFYFRNYSDQNIENFINILDNMNWDSVNNENNPEIAFEKFELMFLNAFNNEFPLNEKINKKHNNIFINSEIKDLMKIRDKLQKKASKWPITYGSAYRKIRNKVTCMIRKEKIKVNKSKLENCKNDTKQTWKVMNNILKPKNSMNNDFSLRVVGDGVVGNDEIIVDQTEIVKKFNEQFLLNGTNLASMIILILFLF